MHQTWQSNEKEYKRCFQIILKYESIFSFFTFIGFLTWSKFTTCSNDSLVS